MSLEQMIVFLLIGGVAGWLAGVILKGGGFGIIGNIIIGILGAVFGGWIFRMLDISLGGELVGSIVTATVGAIVLLFLLGLVQRSKAR